MKIMTIRNRELHRLFIVVGVLLALVTLLFSPIIGNWVYLGIPLGLVVISNTTGVQFDLGNRKYRKYSHICFWTRGEWKDIGSNKNLVILVKHGVKSTTGTLMTNTLKIKGGFSELYLMDETHIRRFFIDSSENHEAIETLALKLSESLNTEIKPYTPKHRRQR
jgi:hypothetical protein